VSRIAEALPIPLLLIWYFTAPLDRSWTPGMALAVAAGLVLVGLVAAGQVRAVMRSAHPRLRAAGALALSLPLVILLFASAYLVMSNDRPQAFSEPLSRVDGLYFATTVFTTVGFGDIAPRSQPARVLVLVQMLADLVYIGLLVRALHEAVRRRDTGQ
jgi:voltage-gated potassium channel